MIANINSFLRKARKLVSPAEWFARLRPLTPPVTAEARPGLVMIQIDGLSLHQLEQAVKEGRLPFIRQLQRRERYALSPLYSGLPATTPAFQGELFYGVRAAVPAFQYFDRELGRMVSLFEFDVADRVEKRLAVMNSGLLEGGSSYSNIYTGGAAEAHFCMAAAGWDERIRARGLFMTLLLLIRVGLSPRGLLLLALEFVLGCTAALTAVLQGQPIYREGIFILGRLSICVLLREFVTYGAMIDIARGVPVIHLNLVGYDEHAHRRGPSSLSAQWALKGIDRAVRDIWKAAHRSGLRSYDVWLYSDHGQEESVGYDALQGESISSTAGRIAASLRIKGRHTLNRSAGRARLLGGRLWPRLFREGFPIESSNNGVAVATMGPVGHVYLSVRPSAAERTALAQELVSKGHVPCVLGVGHPGAAHAWTQEGRLDLPQEAARLLGADHPFLHELSKDLVALAHHPNAGDLVVLGWRAKEKTISWEWASGSHAGPGPGETQAFALLPPYTTLPSGSRKTLRPWDLRQAALHFLGKPTELAALPVVRSRPPEVFRIMTYNIHGCRGTDGRLSIDRIARVIARQHPDVVALQEVDVGRKRSGRADQAAELSARLGMHRVFFSTERKSPDQYGDALFSRHPMHLMHQDRLPGRPDLRDISWRGALWVAVHLLGREINVVNTHLSIWAPKARRQAYTLMGADWIANPDCQPPTILCGDLNSPPKSAVCRVLGRELHDAQLKHAGQRPKKTFFSRIPVGRIDHVFVSDDLHVKAVDVPDTELERVASDHLPLVVDLQFHP